ncbi:MAG TPA: NAD-dependent epimerase/dehydratase family protein [Methylophilaceae bacterium]
MIVAITGGTGFIGQRLALRHLSLGDEVRVLSRHVPESLLLQHPVKWWQGDLSNNLDITGFVDEVDVLYHCAGEIYDVSKMQQLNVEGTSRLIAAASKKISRWVQLSSVGAYGQKHTGLVTEETKPDPGGVYESTKLDSDKLIINAADSGAFEHVILRPSNVYGAGMRNQSLYRLISMINRGVFLSVGKKDSSANYIHVENVVDALILCGTKPAARGQTYNLSDYRTLEDFVGAIAQALDKSYLTIRIPEYAARFAVKVISRLPGISITESSISALTNRIKYACNKIESELSYKHVISMEQGLDELIRYWKSSRITPDSNNNLSINP